MIILNHYYDVRIKEATACNSENDSQDLRLSKLIWWIIRALMSLFAKHAIQICVNLAAQAGVRYSLTNPHAYLESNMHGFLNILEACRHHQVEHLVYASSSSVYGANKKMPFSVHHNVDHPISLYAALKNQMN